MTFILGIIVGLLLALVNLLAYKPEVRRKFMTLTKRKATIVDMEENNLNL